MTSKLYGREGKRLDTALQTVYCTNAPGPASGQDLQEEGDSWQSASTMTNDFIGLQQSQHMLITQQPAGCDYTPGRLS